MVERRHKRKTVGPWARQKLDGLEAYLHHYTTALRKQPFRLVFIDAFAGAGKSRIRDAWQELDEEDKRLLDESFLAQEAQFIEGSPRRALGLENPFDKYFFFDADPARAESLTKMKSEFPERDVSICVGDANVLVRELVPRFNHALTRGVAFLDPYGPHLQWETVQALAVTGKFEA